MEMFLVGIVMSLLGVAVSAALFAAATREQPAPAARPAAEAAVAPGRFFAPTAAVGPAAPQPGRVETEPIPLEGLLLRIEQHIRLEQAAAESFLRRPTGESLHSRTTSPLVN